MLNKRLNLSDEYVWAILLCVKNMLILDLD